MATKKKIVKKTVAKKEVKETKEVKEPKENVVTKVNEKKKKFKFDFIREQILSLKPNLWAKLKPEEIQGLVGFGIRLPIITFEGGKTVTYPALDPYGEEILDLDEYINQRNEYCEKLGNEIIEKKWWENKKILKEREEILNKK